MSTDVIPTSFTYLSDYDISDEQYETLESLTAQINVSMASAVTHMLRVASCLREAKELVPYGAWRLWTEREFGLRVRTAQRYVQVAESFGS